MLSEITNLPPLPPSPCSSSSRRRDSSIRLSFHPENQVQSSPNSSKIGTKSNIKKMPSSMRLFQEQHLNEFAHLHLNEQEPQNSEEREKLLAVERDKLEEARRIGRAKRQTMAHHSSSYSDDKENIDSHAGWRPLSLLARRQPSNKPTTLLVNPTIRPLNQNQRQRRYSNRTDINTPTEIDTPDLSSHLPSEIDINSPDLALITPNQLGLALGCESPPPLPVKSKARQEVQPAKLDENNSVQSSTYSWASSFSGETVELRTAAHYVPSISEEQYTPETGEEVEEILDSPEKVKRRRKRIVAIAHTVRQLEGIGSRDVEDPNFYHQLVKAWNERPGKVQPQEAIWSPSTIYTSPPPIPPRPNQTGLVDPYLAPPAWLAPPLLSPVDTNQQASNSPVPSSNLEHRTPNPEDGGSYDEHSNESYASSNPFRYSYASSIHDLAFAEALQHGNKLMSEKAWLKSPLFDQGTWFDANTPSAPIPVGQFSMAPRIPSPMPNESPSKSSENDAEFACVPSYSHDQKTLRRQNNNINRMKAQDQQFGAPVAIDDAPQAGLSSAPTNWGLGFLGNWLKDELKDDPQAQEGFHNGEEGLKYHRELPEYKVNTRQNSKISSFLAEGDIAGVSNSDDHIYHQQKQSLQSPKQQEITTEMDEMISMESIPLSTNSNLNLVLPPPLPTPEIEIIAQQTGQTKEMISPKQPEECIVIAKEYQLSNPYPRQNYSTPSDILHLQAPAQIQSQQYQHLDLQSTMNLNDRTLHQLQNLQSLGNGDLEVEVEVNPLDLQVQNQDLVSKSKADQEESWDSSEISSYQYQYIHRTSPLKIQHHDKISPPFQPQSQQERTTPVTLTMNIPRLQDLPPLPLSPTITTTDTPPRTPISLQRPNLPPLPPTPKYRRATPPLLINSSSSKRDQEILKSIKGSDKVGVGCHQDQPLVPLPNQLNRHLNYVHSSYLPYTGRDIASMKMGMGTIEVLREDHPSYPAASASTENSQSADASTSTIAEIDTNLRNHAIDQNDIEKALPQGSESKKQSRTGHTMFIMGFICPILWFIGGWGITRIPNSNLSSSEMEKTTTRRRFGIFDHPDSMIRKCRYAAIISIPIILVVVAIIIVLILVL
ncbi:uncharacterized protein I206_106324 [Kwoniella pini CBS 10737]|uniref:Uncharacterized protein n=1 Tax=Kwoniella pini CBS 10737 TaxID=1296096 RepID=A0A1B9HTZ3_9TREE|nr:uncharacterized protein I206_07125 [Kwoniella pini CBS 10737]OCF46738.1 hypothetical protein I206_07125 [Kwoniella pini CBS 10737]